MKKFYLFLFPALFFLLLGVPFFTFAQSANQLLFTDETLSELGVKEGIHPSYMVLVLEQNDSFSQFSIYDFTLYLIEENEDLSNLEAYITAFKEGAISPPNKPDLPPQEPTVIETVSEITNVVIEEDELNKETIEPITSSEIVSEEATKDDVTDETLTKEEPLVESPDLSQIDETKQEKEKESVQEIDSDKVVEYETQIIMQDTQNEHES